MSVQVQVTLDEIMDSPFDIQAEITNDVNESMAQLEGTNFINGDGVLACEGIMTNADISVTNSGKANDLNADTILQMFGAIKWNSYGGVKYDRIYGFNRRTWIKILQLKDGVGRYIWAQGNIEQGIPNTILGTPYAIFPDMDDVPLANIQS